MDNLQNNDVGVCLTSWSNKLWLPSVNLWNRSWFVTFVGPRLLFLVSCRSRPSDKGRGRGAVIQSLRKGGGGLKETFFAPFGPHFGLKIRGDPSPPGPFPGSATPSKGSVSNRSSPSRAWLTFYIAEDWYNAKWILLSTTPSQAPERSCRLLSSCTIAWEKGRHFATRQLDWVSPQNDVWEKSAEIPHWRLLTIQILVVLLIGRTEWKICSNQSEAPPRSG